MATIDNFQLSREELEKRLNWYSNKYGPYIQKRGLHNWKNLFRKPNLQEWIILIMITMAMFIGWAYNHDISQCREFLLTFEDKACIYCNNQVEQASKGNSPQGLNISQININEENSFLEDYQIADR